MSKVSHMYFKLLKFQLLMNEHDEKKIHICCEHVYQAQDDILEYQCIQK